MNRSDPVKEYSTFLPYLKTLILLNTLDFLHPEIYPETFENSLISNGTQTSISFPLQGE